MESPKVQHECPICDLKIDCPLETHLLTHSKESLVCTLLHLKNEPSETSAETGGCTLDSSVSRTPPGEERNFSFSVGSDESKTSDSGLVVGDIDDNSRVSVDDKRSTSLKEGNILTTTQEFPPLSECVKVQEHGNLNFSEGVDSYNVSVVSSSSPSDVNVGSGNECPSIGTDLSSRTYTILETMDLGGAEDCCNDSSCRNEITSSTACDKTVTTRWDKSWTPGNVYPDVFALPTSAIRCIIDESAIGSSAVPKEERLIFLDGRYIPVYSSASDHHRSTGCAAYSGTMEESQSASFGETVSIKNDHSNLVFDLMTDEEIPPKGEISEFEESSTSVMSDDSNISSVLDDSGRSKNILAGRSRPLSFPHEVIGGESSFKKVLQTLTSVTCLSREILASNADQIIRVDGDCLNYKQTAVARTDDVPKQIASDLSVVKNKFEEPGELRLLRDPLNINLSKTEADFEEKTEVSIEPSVLQRKEYFCLYCNFTSPSRSALTCHASTEHPDQSSNPDKFECATCGKIFNSRASLRKHLSVHRKKLFVCTVCSKGFPSGYKLKEHLRVHTGNYPYKCTICGKAYRTPSLLATHEKRVHPDPSKVSERVIPKKVELMCGICHRIMHSKRNLESHLLLHKQKPQKCSYCSETFPRPSVLVRHIRASHDPSHSSQKSKDCSVCGKLLHPNSIKSHLLIHQKEKPHTCPVCHKNFRTLGNLNNHSWSHTSSERPYKCQICPKSYIFLKNLQNHAIVHKRKTLHFVCNECGMKFTNKCNLKRHVEEHSAEKKYTCLVCGKKFFRHYYLNEHVRIHSGSRPYSCTICGKTSSTKSNHVAHVKIHDARESGNLEG